VDDTELRRLARQHGRARKNGTRNPFCCVCGEHHWTVRYDLHHFAEREYDDRTIRLCRTCHEKVTDMQKDYPPVPSDTDTRLARMIAMTRGRIIMTRLSLAVDEELHAWLTAEPFLPPLPDRERSGDGK
jgi:hypothetical protein